MHRSQTLRSFVLPLSSTSVNNCNLASDRHPNSPPDSIVYADENTQHGTTYGVSVSYWDCANADRTCIYCGAMVWYAERTVKAFSPSEPKFSLCCIDGTVLFSTVPSRRTDTKVKAMFDSFIVKYEKCYKTPEEKEKML
ncbi:hypothetical protein L1987_08124 [Smallanthus sonchifolius]|uniref:Uncharacterized protein n=1 Tax=Smallanthus sonchifolius TaxID=185202 RepID=A0ACB9JLI8_9ASTR|nr:hypothetical protein L1987_08124 [Smallanthus sonchifolius]